MATGLRGAGGNYGAGSNRYGSDPKLGGGGKGSGSSRGTGGGSKASGSPSGGVSTGGGLRGAGGNYGPGSGRPGSSSGGSKTNNPTGDLRGAGGNYGPGSGRYGSDPKVGGAFSGATKQAKGTADYSSALSGSRFGGVSQYSNLTAPNGSYYGPKGGNALNSSARMAAASSVGFSAPSITRTPGDAEMLGRMMMAESRAIKNRFGKVNTTGLQAVGDVVRNRMLSERFPNTVPDVLTQRKQFSPIGDGSFARTSANPMATRIAESILSGESPPVVGNALNYGNLDTINNLRGYSSAATRRAFNSMTPTATIADARNPNSLSHTFGTIGNNSDVAFGGPAATRPNVPTSIQVAGLANAGVPDVSRQLRAADALNALQKQSAVASQPQVSRVVTDPRVSVTPLGSLPAAPDPKPKDIKLAWDVPPMGGAMIPGVATPFGVWGTNRPINDPNRGANPGTIHSQTADAAPSGSWMDGIKKQAQNLGLDPDKVITVGTDAVKKLADGNKKVADVQRKYGRFSDFLFKMAGGGPGAASNSAFGNPQDRRPPYYPPVMSQPQQVAEVPQQTDPLSTLNNLMANMRAKGATPQQIAYVQTLIDDLMKAQVA